jgi:hypothetical protein
MPETTVLYSVTGVVILGLVAWVGVVLKSAKEPWARPALPAERADDVAATETPKEEEKLEEPAADEPKATEDPKTDDEKL